MPVDTVPAVGGVPARDNRRAIGRLDGVFHVILSAMRTHSGVAGVQKQACRALWRLAHNDGTWCALPVELMVLVLTVCCV